MMDIKAIAATFIILTLTSLLGAVGVPQLNISPDCSFLQPPLCKPILVMDEDNQVSYDEYEESCPSHVCIALKPIFPKPSSGNTSSKISVGNVFKNRRLFNDFQGEHLDDEVAVRSSAAFTSISNSAEKVSFSTYYDPHAPWFCSVAQINYTARVEANTGFPPGKKEDLYAQCLYQRMMDIQSLGDCRHLRYTCVECREYYRNWLCAMAFPKCDPDKTVTTYPAYNASQPDSVGATGLVPTKVFSILKPCRALCWGVIQMCQKFMNFHCPLSDMRDYGDYPDCNALGFDQGENPYAVSIYR